MIAHLFLSFLVWETFDLKYAVISEPVVNIKRKNKQDSYKYTPQIIRIIFAPLCFISF